MTDRRPIDWRALQELRDLFLSPDPQPEPYWVGVDQMDSYDQTLGERIGWKWDAVLRELKMRQWTPPAAVLHDVGCGTGIAARRLLAAYPGHFSQVTVHDHSRIAMGFAHGKITQAAPGMRVCLGTPDAPLDGVVLLSHLITELTEPGFEALLLRLENAAAILWVEPGTKPASHRLVMVRERFRDRFRIAAPCTHDQVCGMTLPQNAPHWCHHFAPAPREVHQDPFWGIFRKELNLELGPLAYGFLVLDHQSEPMPGWSHLIGRPLRAPKFLRVLSCQSEDIADLVASRRAEDDVYRPLKNSASPAVYRFERKKNRITGGEWIGAATEDAGPDGD
jgi:hypothetical protein